MTRELLTKPRKKRRNGKRRERLSGQTPSTPTPDLPVRSLKSFLKGELNKTLIAQYAELVKEGLPFDTVNDYLGVGSNLFYLWLGRGKTFIDREGFPEEDALYGLFYANIRHASALYRIDLTRKLHGPSSDKTWIRWITILERRDRATWGRHEQDGGAIDDLDPDQKYR